MDILTVVDMVVDIQMMLLNSERLFGQKGGIVPARKIDLPGVFLFSWRRNYDKMK